MKEQIAKIRQVFQQQFGADPTFIASAPGRVNLIGEHTDYMGGLVLPVAIDKQVLFAVRGVAGETITGYSLDYAEKVSFTAGHYDPAHPCRWLRYVLGVLLEMEKEGIAIGGFDFCVTGNVPIGSGLSSSAALELATLKAALALHGQDLGKKEAALLCQRAENGFVGVQCGIMDQYISSSGIADHALKIDCADLSYEAVEAVAPGHTWLLIDSRKKRGLVDSIYNFRISQCHAGLKQLQSFFPRKKISNLRDVSWDELLQARESMEDSVFRRVRHVISENLRVERTCQALQGGDLKTVAENLGTSHQSLRDDFEVSSPELDALVEIVSGIEGVSGARLTGAGFGGCIIALVRDDAVARVLTAARAEYPIRFPRQTEPIEAWPIRISDGAKLVLASTPSAQTSV